MSTAQQSQPLFYKNVVPINKEQHGALCIEPVEGFDFANESSSLYIAAIEFAQREMAGDPHSADSLTQYLGL